MIVLLSIYLIFSKKLNQGCVISYDLSGIKSSIFYLVIGPTSQLKLHGDRL